jgi:uncharacterized protein YjiS (DUF1127 family)
MNAPIAKHDLAFNLGNLSYIGPAYEDAPASSVKQHPVRHWFADCWAAIHEWRQRQAVLQEMQMMTDRELADVGLSRADLGRIFDPAFAADRRGGSNYIGF